MIAKRNIVVVGLLVSEILVAGCSDREASSFATLKEARASQAMARGWIPGNLPESAVDLREVHDVDTNEVWGTFSFGTSDHGSAIKLLDPSKINGRTVRSPSVDWWPRVLTGRLDGRVLEKNGLELYSTPPPHAFWIALDRNRGRGFFWSP